MSAPTSFNEDAQVSQHGQFAAAVHPFNAELRAKLGGDAPDVASTRIGRLAHLPYPGRLHAGAFALLATDGRCGIYGDYGPVHISAWLWHQSLADDLTHEDKQRLLASLRSAFLLALAEFPGEPPWWFQNLVAVVFGPADTKRGAC